MDKNINNWIMTANGIKSGDIEITYEDERSFPFFLTYNYGVICGYNGTKHSKAIADGDVDGIIVTKLIRMYKDEPDTFNELFSDQDISESIDLMKIKQCAEIVKDDIYCNGRCFDLTDEYDCVVFTFWEMLDFTDQYDAISSVCQQANISPRNATVAKPEKEEKKPELDSPDSITFDGVKYSCFSKNAYPFIVFNENSGKITVRYGEGGEFHALLTSRIKKGLVSQLRAKNPTADPQKFYAVAEKFIDKMAVVEGRYWELEDKTLFTFWNEYKSYDQKELIEQICQERSIDTSSVYYSKFGQWIGLNDDLSYNPTDDDYSGMEDNTNGMSADDYKAALDKLKQIHNPENGEDRISFEKRKKEALDGYRAEREKMLADKLKYADKPGSMTDAEYRWRTSMDENSNKHNKKSVFITESQANNLKNK